MDVCLCRRANQSAPHYAVEVGVRLSQVNNGAISLLWKVNKIMREAMSDHQPTSITAISSNEEVCRALRWAMMPSSPRFPTRTKTRLSPSTSTPCRRKSVTTTPWNQILGSLARGQARRRPSGVSPRTPSRWGCLRTLPQPHSP